MFSFSTAAASRLRFPAPTRGERRTQGKQSLGRRLCLDYAQALTGQTGHPAVCAFRKETFNPLQQEDAR